MENENILTMYHPTKLLRNGQTTIFIHDLNITLKYNEDGKNIQNIKVDFESKRKLSPFRRLVNLFKRKSSIETKTKIGYPNPNKQETDFYNRLNKFGLYRV